LIGVLIFSIIKKFKNNLYLNNEVINEKFREILIDKNNELFLL
jgi:hypothetical protein